VSPVLHSELPHLVEMDTGPAPHDYGTGRRCSCGTKLSRYNPGPLCWRCERAQLTADAKAQVRAVEAKREHVCPVCARKFTASHGQVRYCSDHCRRIARWKREQESRRKRRTP